MPYLIVSLHVVVKAPGRNNLREENYGSQFPRFQSVFMCLRVMTAIACGEVYVLLG